VGGRMRIGRDAPPDRRFASAKEPTTGLTIAGGLRAELADDLRAPLPEQLATLMRRLEGDRNGHSGEGVRLWDKPTRNVEPC
jgi:hypothetical protein